MGLVMLYILVAILSALGGGLIGLALGGGHGFRRALDHMYDLAHRCGPLEGEVIRRAAQLIEEEERG